MERLTQVEAADMLGISISMLGNLQRRGQLKGTYFRLGRRVIYMKEKLIRWMEAGGTLTGEVNRRW